MQLFEEAQPPCQLQGAILLLPAVNSGNVGQLALDLLISTLQLPRVGRFETTSVLPCAGNDAFSHQAGHLALSLELYEVQRESQGKMFVLQQRAPAAPGCQQRFAKELSDWIKQARFGQVLLLASLDPTMRRDRQIGQKQISYFANDSAVQQQCQGLGWVQLQDVQMAQIAEQYSLIPPFTMLQAFSQQSIELLCISVYANEGNNAPDACQMVDAACQYLQLTIPKHTPPQTLDLPCMLTQAQWLMPLSWQCVYGNFGSQGMH